MSEAKVLKMTIKEPFFTLIVTGKKKVEYRQNTKHWISRIYDFKRKQAKEIDAIEFRNGYHPDSPVAVVELRFISYKKKENELWFFLGKVLYTANLKKKKKVGARSKS